MSASPDPVLHVLAGPNGAGKTTFYDEVLAPVTQLPFVNADLVAARRWPDAAAEHAYDAARLAAAERAELIAARTSFATETVFSHESKVALLRDARAAGYLVALHVVLVPEDLAVARVVDRVRNGGHAVPEHKVRARYHRLWTHVSAALGTASEAYVYDNSRAAQPFRLVATYLGGRLVGEPRWPAWTPAALRDA